MFKTTLASAAVGLVLAATPAAAGSRDDQQFSIEYRDLDLSTEQGQKALDQRIDKAAREVCGLGSQRTGTRIQSSSAKKCFAQVRATAQKQMASLVAEQQRGG